jgi:homospermidine synthase
MVQASVSVRQPFAGRMLVLGFGCIGQAVLPLLLRHVDLAPRQIVVVSADIEGAAVAQEYGVALLHERITTHNLRSVLGPHLGAGDFLLNLSVDVSSVALIELCRERGALYLDTCIEPWAGGYVDAGVTLAARTNYALREAALGWHATDAPTAVVTHGANPGLVSHFVKRALLDLSGRAAAPADRVGWAQLAQSLGVRAIHIAERDTQCSRRRKAMHEFVNTWSVDAFISEAVQPAELGWGTHERHFPADGRRHRTGSRAAIYLRRPGATTRVRSWTPLSGPQQAFLITHGESISIADQLTLGSRTRPTYRPTVHYAYHPCDDAVLSLHELAARNWQPQPAKRVLRAADTEPGGIDELGVLLMGQQGGAYWFGSRLSIETATALAPHNSATSLQVAAGVLAGVVWAMRHPRRGVVEPDDMPFDEVLALALPYLGEMIGVRTGWTPLEDRATLFDEPLDNGDPWQFINFRVS